jgi:hypothetical protein
MLLDARYRFAEARAACAELGRVSSMLESLDDGSWDGSKPWAARSGGSKPVHSDPTASSAASRLAVIGGLRARYDALAATIEEAGTVVEQVGRFKGQRYARVLDLYYLGGVRLLWREVADELTMAEGATVTEDAAKKRRDRACEWVDKVGWERILMDAAL